MQCGDHCSSECIALTICYHETAEAGNRGRVARAVSEDHSINEWRQRLECVVQQNGTNNFTAFLLLFMRICVLLLSLLAFCAISTLITHAVLCVATYR